MAQRPIEPFMGRFDRSFVVRMIRDFFIGLLFLTLLQAALDFAVALYRFETDGDATTTVTAERLAGDLKDIMLNRGGPVAARTIYPTWQRNYDELGFEVALIPAPVTVSSIQALFDFTPTGLPPTWPSGRHHEARVALRAEPFCINCHIDANPGDVLGWVVVRRYLADAIAIWRQSAQQAAIIAGADLILGTIVLFFLLRLRMEPLLSLRGTIARLAKGHLDLTPRTPVHSTDEFGELAHDLNLFLDRLAELLEDVRPLLAHIAELSAVLEGMATDAAGVTRTLDSQLDQAHNNAVAARAAAAQARPGDLDLLIDVLQQLATHERIPTEAQSRLHLVADRLQATAEAIALDEGALERVGAAIRSAQQQLHEQGGLTTELVQLSKHMQALSATGKMLLSRVTSDGEK